MNLKKFSQLLQSDPEAPLHIMLPSGELIPSHFHVTEVGKVQKNFIDCGGTQRESISCVLQVWTADDVEHRLSAGKLSNILKLAETTLQSDDLPVEIEYGPKVSSTFTLSQVERSPKGLVLALVGKQTDCLAPDKCGVKCQGGSCKGGNCC